MLLVNVMLTVLLIASFIMSLLPATCAWEPYLKIVFMLFPNYVLGDAMLQISNLESLGFLKIVCQAQRDPTYIQTHAEEVRKLSTKKYDAFDWEAVGMHCAVLAVEFVVYFSAALLIDVIGSYPKIKTTLCGCVDPIAKDEAITEDVDIAAERNRIMQQHGCTGRGGDGVAVAADATEDGAEPQGNDALTVKGLRKVFRTRNRRGGRGVHCAVVNSWFGVKEGEVFGLLGVNGAGKSTTLKMLSGDLMPSAGTAQMCGNDILTQQLAVRRLLGYCPQHNALLPLLTVEEHLQLFARIKGVGCGAALRRVVEQKMRQLDLTSFKRTRASNLSGGNKRKLSVGIAMIGNPRIIFLDEPSAGMDPVAKRFMWDLITRISRGNPTAGERMSGIPHHGTTIVLTTHSMEECSALCDRMCIMVDGRLRCLGSEQHLKHRYGRNLQAQIKLEEPSRIDDIAPLLGKLALAIRFLGNRAASKRSVSSSAKSKSTNSPASLGAERESGFVGVDDVVQLPAVEEHGRLVIEKSQIGAACEALGCPERARLFRDSFADQEKRGMDYNSSRRGEVKQTWCARARCRCMSRGHVNGEDMGDYSTDSEKGGKVRSNPSWLLAEEFSRTGWVHGHTFARWWLLLDWSESLETFLSETFNRSTIASDDDEVHRIEQHETTLRFVIPKPPRISSTNGCGIGLGSIFGRIERVKESLHISEYSVSQTSLDQIFIDFARTQKEAMQPRM
jgi:ABC-type multidrug transport system ATPase subunit